jgi:hypothetical protein
MARLSPEGGREISQNFLEWAEEVDPAAIAALQ